MKEPLKYFIERTTLIGAIARKHRNRQLRKKYLLWEKQGAEGTMPNYGKQQTVIEYIKRFSPDIFIETGTYRGKMVYAVMPYIKEMYSIELDEKHSRNAQQRFAGYPNIHIIQGQSGQVLPEILKDIKGTCLFWLDAHYSGGSTAKGALETPICQEMDCILRHKKGAEHIILIDDARCFEGKNDYPTIEQLKNLVAETFPGRDLEVKNDIIRIYPVVRRKNY
jgi:hypothetical protein